MPSTIPTHAYVADPGTSDRRGGVESCAHCPMPRGHAVHDLPAVPADAALVDARRLGESTEGDQE